MSDRLVTIEEAARRVERSRRTILRWIEHDHLRVFNGKVVTDHLLEVDRRMRSRVGRPSGQRVPLVLDGVVVGHLTIRPDGEISGRMKP